MLRLVNGETDVLDSASRGERIVLVAEESGTALERLRNLLPEHG